MPRKIRHQLSVPQVNSLPPGRYWDGGGLTLLVRRETAKEARRDLAWWIFRGSFGGNVFDLGLGPARGPDAISLKTARGKAEKLRVQIRDGIDPREERRQKKAAVAAARALPTFKEVAESYIASHREGWRNAKHAAQWTATLEAYAYPIVGDMSVAAIDTGHVTRILEPVWTKRPETASRVRGRIESVLDYARVRGWRSGENPARWKGHLQNILPAKAKVRRVEHFAALPWRDIGLFMDKLLQQPGIGALALRFTILTAARSGEVRGARWSEIDLANGVWTVPGSRMKAGREHRVPLSEAALDVLREAAKLRQGAGDAIVFPGLRGKPLSDMSLSAVLRRMERGDLTVHGFRSTFRDWCAETTAYPRELAEAALAHVLSDKTEAAYQRGDYFAKRVQMMESWAAFCGKPLVAEGNAVVPMRRVSG